MQRPPPGAAPSQEMLDLNLTTEQIQMYLDENKNLIMAILDSQNLGKFAECASYQGRLQQNLTYLARIADNQPPGAAVTSSQTIPQPSLQSAQQEQYDRPSQAAMTQQQPVYFPSRPPFLSTDQSHQLPPHLQQHFNQGQTRMRRDGDTQP